MHQPYYEDLATGEHILPWVRLHAIKDYWGMVALLEEFPRVRLTFNLVPSLLIQVQAFAEQRAQDRHLEVGLKPVDMLDESDRVCLVQNGFHAPFDRMIRPFARYAALHAKRHTPAEFDDSDLRDLQIWHKLAWMDPDRLTRDTRLVALVTKGEQFSEDDKQILRAVELEILGAVMAAYRAAQERGQIELSTSPFYHPILPLLCDSDSHLRAHPHSALPRALFRRRQDARLQIERAIDLHASLFGRKPAGIWPSEGSVSDDTAALIAEAGFAWMATDETILARSLQRAVSAKELYRPYELGNGEARVRCLFRDHGLSDVIGFSYQSWDAAAAADDFLGRLRDADRRFSGESSGEAPTVAVILDGENAWEHYAGGGRPFLRALYQRLNDATDITMVTMAEAAAAPATPLESLFPGSWINGDFYIWAGHADDHRAWTQLAAARDAFDRFASQVDPGMRQQAFEELLIAEGSDWFWWYGDDHSSEHDRAFDELFRRHLRNVYRALDVAAPDELHLSNITTSPLPHGPLPVESAINPTLDGHWTGFAEWAGAVRIPLGRGGGTMHRVTSALVSGIWVGLGAQQVFIRIDGPELVRRVHAGELNIEILIAHPVRERLEFRGPSDGSRSLSAASIIEIALDVAAIGLTAGTRATFSVLVTDTAGQVVEQHPSASVIEIECPSRPFELAHWTV